MKTVKQDAYILEFAANRMKNDKEVVMVTIKICSEAYTFCIDTLCNDFELALEAVR